MDEPIDPLVFVTAEIIHMPTSRALDVSQTRAFFDNIALGGEQMLELFMQLGCSRHFPQVLNAEAFEELRVRFAIDNTDPIKVRYESETGIVIIIHICLVETVPLDAQAILMGRELAVAHLARLIKQTGIADLRSEELLNTLKQRVYGNVSAFELMCGLEPRRIRGVCWTDLLDR